MRYDAAYTITGSPGHLAADDGLFLDVTLENMGEAAWPHRGHHNLTLSYRWRDAAGNLVPGEGIHLPLPQSVAPGGRMALELSVEPPPRLGPHTLQVELVEEGVTWLSEQGAVPALLPFQILPPSDLPRVCLVSNACRAYDAVSGHILEQVRFFTQHGYRPLVLVGDIDPRLSREDRRALCQVTLADLRCDTPILATRRAFTHFHAAELLVFHYSTYYPLAEAIRLVGNGQVIFDYHGVTPPSVWQGAQGGEELEAGARNLSLARYADVVLAHSAFARDELAAAAGLPPARIRVLPYAVPLAAFRPGPPDPAFAARYGLAGRILLLYVGRMAANKRVIDLVRALPRIQRRHPNAALLLVGDTQTPPYPQLVAEARVVAAAEGVSSSVVFAGQVEDLAACYRSCALVVTASVHEGFCIPVVEGQASGRPVVGAHATALPETIGPGGRTFPPGDIDALAATVSDLLDGFVASEA